MYIILSILIVLSVAAIAFINQPSFGRLPHGERLERVRKSSNYRDGKFQNLSPTQQITSDKSLFSIMMDFLFKKVKDLRPETDLPTIKTDLKQLNHDEEMMVWLGHSSVFIQANGQRFLVDPVLVMSSPVSFFNKAFKGTDIYSPSDMPDIDFLIISHDHWDHLDYNTIKQLKDRIGKVICPLGVGEHLEYWGFDKNSIIEFDWNENKSFANGLTIYCLPARHFSGRGLSSNQTLWASFMLQTPAKNIFISGDSGYDTHFSDINKQFPNIDLAIMENGQYDKDWKYIHMLPEDLAKAIVDLKPKKVLTVHNSKFALAKHTWHEPMETVAENAEKDSFNLLTPMIGEVVSLNDTTQVFKKWWKN